MKFAYTGDQEKLLEAITQFLGSTEKYMVVQGSAGCGKSFMIGPILRKAEEFFKMRGILLKDPLYTGLTPYLTATTNPAAAVLSGYADKAEIRTIHSFLGLTPKKNFQTGRLDFVPKKNAVIRHGDLIIVDEGSMIDIPLKKNMDKLIDDSCKVIIMGDWYQLSAVGETKTVMEQMVCPTVKMNKIMRNSGIIAQTGQQFRETVDTGIFKPIPTGHPELQIVDGPTFQSLVDAAFTDPNYSPDKAKVIAWTNDMVIGYNNHIRAVKGQPVNMQVGETVHTNKPIMTKNYSRTVDSIVNITGAGAPLMHDEYNIPGRYVELDACYTGFLPDSQADAKRIIRELSRNKRWTEYFDINESWLDLRVPYASTVYKAQGNSHDVVFINLADIGQCTIASDVARMLYVAISRARKQVYLFGELPACYAG